MPFDLKLPVYKSNCDLCFLKGKNYIKRVLSENPLAANWWIEKEERVNATFHKEYSYKQLVDAIRRSPTLFDYDDAPIECICNLD